MKEKISVTQILPKYQVLHNLNISVLWKVEIYIPVQGYTCIHTHFVRHICLFFVMYRKERSA